MNLNWTVASDKKNITRVGILSRGATVVGPFFLLLALVLAFLYASKTQAQTLLPSQSAYLESLKQNVLNSHLAFDRQWLLLGHWKKTWTGHYFSEAGDNALFLSHDGKKDPEAELLATLIAFAQPVAGDDEKSDGQCRFLARRSWLYEALKIDENLIPRHPCPKIETWKRKLGADGVTLIFADAYMGNAASMFGHTFLKFHSKENQGDRDLLNYGVNFFASTGSDGGVPFAFFGLTGHYPGTFSLLPYHETLRTYASLEGRDVWEYRLALSPGEIDQLINHLLELQQTYFDYYFLTKNCSYQILAALEAAKPELHLTDQFWHEVIPADTVRAIQRTPGFVTSINYRPSLQTQFQESKDHLTEDLFGGDFSLVRKLARTESGREFSRAEQELKLEPIEKQAKILDSAMMYTDLLKAKKPMEYADRAYRLQTLRAMTGVNAPSEGARSYSEAKPPEAGHDSARAGLGLGSRNGDGFADLQTRLAYHNLLSNDTGYLANTQLEVFRISARKYASMDRPLFQEFTLIDTISLSPTDHFFQPLAWRADVGVTRLPDRPASESPAFSANGGFGYAFYPLDFLLKNFLIFGFIQANGDAGADIDRGYRVGGSAQAQILYKPISRFSFNAGYELRSYFFGNTKTIPTDFVRTVFSPTRNLELRADWTHTDQILESRAMLFWHFMI